MERFMQLLLIYGVIQLVFGSEQRFANTTLQLGLHGCNFRTFCSVTANVPLSDAYNNNSCCLPCSCASDCWFFGDCCPDVEAELSESKFGDIHLTCESTELDILMKGKAGPIYYKMITQCPLHYSDYNTKNLCEIPFDSEFSRFNVSFHDIVTVSSLDNVVFRNVYCAKCHGINEVHRWNLIVSSCHDIVYAATAGYIDFQGIIEKCLIISIPPEGVRVERSICYTDTISTCSVEGGPTVIDEDIEKACDFSKFPVYQIHAHSQVYYSNVFCLLCNSPNTKLPITCDHGIRDPNILRSYTNFFNFDTNMVMATPVPRITRCRMDQVYDDNMETCRKLICPFTRKPENEECVDSGQHWFETSISFPVLISTEYINLITRPEGGYSVAKAFLDSVGLSTLCDVCSFKSFSESSTEWSIITELNIVLTNKCKYENIEESITPIKYSDIRLHVLLERNLSVNISLKIFPKVNRAIGFNPSIGVNLDTCDLVGSFKMNSVFDCPYVILNETEYCLWINSTMDRESKACLISSDDVHVYPNIDIFYVEDIIRRSGDLMKDLDIWEKSREMEGLNILVGGLNWLDCQ